MFKIGSIVIGNAGRDSDNYFAVVGVDEKFVYICNGKQRPIERPKRKNPKHITLTGFEIDAENMATNRRLRKTLSRMKDESNN